MTAAQLRVLGVLVEHGPIGPLWVARQIYRDVPDVPDSMSPRTDSRSWGGRAMTVGRVCWKLNDLGYARQVGPVSYSRLWDYRWKATSAGVRALREAEAKV